MTLKIAFLTALFVTCVDAQTSVYDPLSVKGDNPKSLELVLKDGSRKRDIPLRVYLPDSSNKAEVIIFSHGLGGSRDNNPYLGNHWAKRGYVAVFVQHAGSDESVWKNAPAGERFEVLKDAASAEAFLDRAKDIPAVIDALENWNILEGHKLNGTMNLNRIGMVGHSFGAVTT